MTRANDSVNHKPTQALIAEEAARLANRKIAALQRGYTGSDNAGGAQARAELARLRRLNSSQGHMWFSVGEAVFDHWPREKLVELGVTSRDEDRVAQTVEDVLGLYALHQQSISRGCAIIKGKSEDDEQFRQRRRRGSFGHACRLIEQDLTKASNVQRRLAAIENAADYNGVLYGLRMLIGLMKRPQDKSKDLVQLDYWQLAEDLYLIQLAGAWKSNIIGRWARDYFTFESDVSQQQ